MDRHLSHLLFLVVAAEVLAQLAVMQLQLQAAQVARDLPRQSAARASLMAVAAEAVHTTQEALVAWAAQAEEGQVQYNKPLRLLRQTVRMDLAVVAVEMVIRILVQAQVRETVVAV